MIELETEAYGSNGILESETWKLNGMTKELKTHTWICKWQQTLSSQIWKVEALSMHMPRASTFHISFEITSSRSLCKQIWMTTWPSLTSCTDTVGASTFKCGGWWRFCCVSWSNSIKFFLRVSFFVSFSSSGMNSRTLSIMSDALHLFCNIFRNYLRETLAKEKNQEIDLTDILAI